MKGEVSLEVHLHTIPIYIKEGCAIPLAILKEEMDEGNANVGTYASKSKVDLIISISESNNNTSLGRFIIDDGNYT